TSSRPMPTYDFRCPAGHEFERFFSRISDSPREVPCEECDAIAERQVSGGAGLHFKGSGFYITDYGKDGKKDQRARAEKSEGGKGEKKSTGGEGGGGGESSGKSSSSGSSSGSSASGSSSAGSESSSGGSSQGSSPGSRGGSKGGSGGGSGGSGGAA